MRHRPDAGDCATLHRHQRSRNERPAQVDAVHALCHDLRQSLATILLLAQEPPKPDTAEEAADEEDSPAPRRLAAIRAQAEWLCQVVDSVLDVPVTGEAPCIDIVGLVAGVVDRARPATPTRIQFLAPAEAPWHTDGVAVARVVTSLLDNATRAAGPDGEVFVRVQAENGVTISVSDDGPGFGAVPPVHSLGLTIARALCGVSGARLSLSPNAAGGVRAEVHLAPDGADTLPATRHLSPLVRIKAS